MEGEPEQRTGKDATGSAETTENGREGGADRQPCLLSEAYRTHAPSLFVCIDAGGPVALDFGGPGGTGMGFEQTCEDV